MIEYNDAAHAANAGERSSDYADHYFRTAPRLETGDERYAWVNRTLFVGEGRLHPGPVVEYRVSPRRSERLKRLLLPLQSGW